MPQAGVIKAALELIAQVSTLLTTSLRALQKCEPDLGSEACTWEAFLEKAGALSDPINDLGAGRAPQAAL